MCAAQPPSRGGSRWWSATRTPRVVAAAASSGIVTLTTGRSAADGAETIACAITPSSWTMQKSTKPTSK